MGVARSKKALISEFKGDTIIKHNKSNVVLGYNQSVVFEHGLIGTLFITGGFVFMNSQQNPSQLKKNKNSILIFWAIALVGALFLISTIFWPFASATEDFREYLQEESEEMYAEEIDMTNEDAEDLSLLEFGKIYSNASELDADEEMAIACLVVIAAFIIFAVLTTLFIALKKPIVAIIFNLLSFGVFQIIKWDFEDRGVIPSRYYDWGFAETACCIGVAIVMIGSILLLIAKIKAKRQQKQEIA